MFGDLRFVGTTLWSDFDALALRRRAQTPTVQELLKQRQRPFAANFYLEKAAAAAA